MKRTQDGLPRASAALALLVTGIVFSLLVRAFAAHAMTTAGSDEAARLAGSAQEIKMTGSADAAERAARCGKCHSACEEGAIHAGQSPLLIARGVELPLDAEGVIGCSTCHISHREGVGGAVGARLRVSNLRRELCLSCHGGGDDETPRVEIISPLEQAIVQESHLALIGRATRLAGAQLTVRLNGSDFNLHVRDGHFFTWLTLLEGVNRVEVAQGDATLWKGEVFRGGNGTDSYGRTSSGHGTGNREECLGCHLSQGGMSAETTGAAPALCYACHDRIDGKRYVHGPLAVGDCLVCHDPHGGLGAAHLRQEQGLLCRSCHSTRENTARVTCDASGKGCVACHDPHQSDARYLLKGPQYTMLDAAAAGR